MLRGKKFYSIAEFAKLFNYSQRSVRQMCIDGRIKAKKITLGAKKWLIPASELKKLQADRNLITKVEPKRYEGIIETSHPQQIREVAKAVAEGISLPSARAKDLWSDLPLEFKPEKYSLSIGKVVIGENRQIEVNYYDIAANFAPPHFVGGLYSHLDTSRWPRFRDLVGEQGKLRHLVLKAGQYSQKLLILLRVIADDVMTCRAKVNFHDETKPGLTKWFALTVWNDSIQKADNHPWIDDSWYRHCEGVPDTNLWQLRCGAYVIGIAGSRKTLKTYENWHRKLRVKYAVDPLAEEIATINRDMNYTAREIRQRLQEFADMVHRPGRCELCHPRRVRKGSQSGCVTGVHNQVMW